MTNDKYIEAFWYSSSNFGDALNHFLIKELSGKIPVLATNRNESHYICCGSILGEYTAASKIWGAGFFYDHQKLSFDIPIYSVRGELTKKQVGKDVAVGDPALLLPLLYQPAYHKTHKIGIIPHWSNIKNVINSYPDYHIIDPMQSIKDFIDDVSCCENIFSESLHGLIVADTYSIPNMWVHFGADLGGYFKYEDYYSTVTNSESNPDLKVYLQNTKIHKYKHDLKSLLNSCPFYNGLNSRI